VSIIGGLVYRDPARTVEPAVRDALLPGAMAAESFSRLDIQGGALAGNGSGIVSGRSGDATLMADMDLTNLDELPGSPDGADLVQCLERFHAQDDTNFVIQLRGAFGIALWIPSRRRLVLAADRLGFRRLYYAVSNQGIAFGSRVKAPLALPGLSREIDADAVYAYLNFGTVPAPQSIYRAVRRLAPGQILVWENGRVSLHQYWDVVYSERRLDKSEAARTIYGQTAEAVRQTLTGLEAKDTGAFLSGGTDSSVVVGLMSRLTRERVQAFSIGFQEERYNELEYAELAARHFAAAHYARIVTADEALQCLPDIVEAYDEPFGNNSALPAYLCARYAREAGVRVLLAGDGGDEIFGGNERYRREGILARYHRIPRLLRRGLIEPLARCLPAEAPGLTGKARRYVERASAPNPDRFYSSEFFVSQNRQWLLEPGFLGRITGDWPLRVARGHFVAAGRTAELNRLPRRSQDHPRRQRPLQGGEDGGGGGDRRAFPVPASSARGVHGHPPRAVQGAGYGEALHLQASLPRSSARADPRQSQARLRVAHERLAQAAPGLPGAGTGHAALATGPRAWLLRARRPGAAVPAP